MSSRARKTAIRPKGGGAEAAIDMAKWDRKSTWCKLIASHPGRIESWASMFRARVR